MISLLCEIIILKKEINEHTTKTRLIEIKNKLMVTRGEWVEGWIRKGNIVTNVVTS